MLTVLMAWRGWWRVRGRTRLSAYFRGTAALHGIRTLSGILPSYLQSMITLSRGISVLLLTVAALPERSFAWSPSSLRAAFLSGAPQRWQNRRETSRWASWSPEAIGSMPPFPAQDLERDHNDLQILTHRLYQVMNERRSEEFRGLWLDGEEVLFHAGDGNITKGGAAVSDLFRQVRIDEHYVDPGRRGIMLHPTVEISDVRVIVNGLHAWVTCQEQFTRGLKPNSAGPVQPAHGTNIYRKSNGDWKLVVHWSGRLSLVRDQVDELMRARREANANSRSRGKQSQNPMMSGWDDDDDDDDADIVFESWGDLEDDDDEEVILEESEEAESLLQQAAAWDRSAAMRKTTKKALAAVRRIFQDGRITKQEKRKLIFSVIRSASQDEISLVEQAYDLLVQRDVGGQGESCMEEFADQCRVIATMYVQAIQSTAPFVVRGGTEVVEVTIDGQIKGF